MLGEILGPDMIVVVAIVALLFGGSQIPKLARSLGTARKEFERGLHDDGSGNDSDSDSESPAKRD